MGKYSEAMEAIKEHEKELQRLKELTNDRTTKYFTKLKIRLDEPYFFCYNRIRGGEEP